MPVKKRKSQLDALTLLRKRSSSYDTRHVLAVAIERELEHSWVSLDTLDKSRAHCVWVKDPHNEVSSTARTVYYNGECWIMHGPLMAVDITRWQVQVIRRPNE